MMNFGPGFVQKPSKPISGGKSSRTWASSISLRSCKARNYSATMTMAIGLRNSGWAAPLARSAKVRRLKRIEPKPARK